MTRTPALPHGSGHRRAPHATGQAGSPWPPVAHTWPARYVARPRGQARASLAACRRIAPVKARSPGRSRAYAFSGGSMDGPPLSVPLAPHVLSSSSGGIWALLGNKGGKCFEVLEFRFIPEHPGTGRRRRHAGQCYKQLFCDYLAYCYDSYRGDRVRRGCLSCRVPLAWGEANRRDFGPQPNVYAS